MAVNLLSESYGTMMDRTRDEDEAREYQRATRQNALRMSDMKLGEMEREQQGNALLRGASIDQITPQMLMQAGRPAEAINLYKQQREEKAKTVEWIGNLSHSVKDQASHKAARRMLGAMHPTALDDVPEQYDPKFWEASASMALAAKDRLKQQPVVKWFDNEESGGQTRSGYRVFDPQTNSVIKEVITATAPRYKPGSGGEGGGGPTRSQAHNDKLHDAEVIQARQTLMRMPETERFRAYQRDRVFMELAMKAQRPLRTRKDYDSWYVTKGGKILIDGKERNFDSSKTPVSTPATGINGGTLKRNSDGSFDYIP